MTLFQFAVTGGTLSTLALAWLHRHDISICYRIWKLNRSIPDAVPIPEADPWPSLTGWQDDAKLPVVQRAEDAERRRLTLIVGGSSRRIH